MHIILLFTSLLVLLVMLILRGRKGPSPLVRPLSAFQDLRSEIGFAAESGSAVHIALGSGRLYGEDTITSLAGLRAVESLIDTAVSYNAPPIITVGDPTLLPLAQDILRRAYERNGIPEAYNPNYVRFVAPSPVAYAAGTAHTVATENVTTNVMTGAFGSEVSLIADAGARRHSQTPDKFGCLVGQDIAEHICGNDDIHLSGVSQNSSAHIIDIEMLVIQVGVSFYLRLHYALNQAA